MLEDFIESNNLKARVLPYAAKGKLIKCKLFSYNDSFALVIFFSSDRLSEQKISVALNTDRVKPVEGFSVEEITGYMAEFLPPISVYGVTVLIDKKLFGAETVKCIVGEEKTLAIRPKEIQEANEESIVADVSV